MCLNLYSSKLPFLLVFILLAAIYKTCLGQTELCIVTSDWTAEREAPECRLLLLCDSGTFSYLYCIFCLWFYFVLYLFVENVDRCH